MQVARLVDRARQPFERRRRPRLRTERRDHLVGVDLGGGKQLGPGPLLGAELAQAQLAAAGEPHQHPRAAVLQRRSLVEQLEPAGRHQVDEQRELARLDDGHLADPAHTRDPLAGERIERRVEALHRHHPGRHGGLDLGAIEPRRQAARGYLDFGDLGHGLRLGIRKGLLARLDSFIRLPQSELANIRGRSGMQPLPTIQPSPQPSLSRDQMALLSDEVRALAAERDAVILAHNYQVPEIQDVADYVGDSLGLSRRAAATDSTVIAFCGVHFMAETASVLSPDKTVLIPDPDAGCSLSDSITADQLRAWKSEHPSALVVMYVNTSAEVKAETDYCCTSSNAVQVVDHIWREHGPQTEILFGPDMWLGSFVARELGLIEDPERYARFHVWDGECHVHAGIRPDDIAAMRAEHPDAEFLIHPECGCSTQAMEYVASGDLDTEGVQMLSTSGMLRHVHHHPHGEFIVATETGMLYPLQQAAPGARLIEANRMAFCRYMKMITLPKLRDSLHDLRHEVKVSPEIARRARVPIE